MSSIETRVIFHMTPQAHWESQRDLPHFASDTLAEEGFIHCTAEPERLLYVANTFYRDRREPYIILCIALERLESELRWEMADNHLFPHIYGPVNRSAIAGIVPFTRLPDHTFVLPQDLREQAR